MTMDTRTAQIVDSDDDLELEPDEDDEDDDPEDDEDEDEDDGEFDAWCGGAVDALHTTNWTDIGGCRWEIRSSAVRSNLG